MRTIFLDFLCVQNCLKLYTRSAIWLDIKSLTHYFLVCLLSLLSVFWHGTLVWRITSDLIDLGGLRSPALTRSTPRGKRTLSAESLPLREAGGEIKVTSPFLLKKSKGRPWVALQPLPPHSWTMYSCIFLGHRRGLDFLSWELNLLTFLLPNNWIMPCAQRSWLANLSVVAQLLNFGALCYGRQPLPGPVHFPDRRQG